MKNWKGEELSAAQAGLAETYEKLHSILVKHESDLAPFEERNAKKALSCLWQIMNGLDLDPEQLYEIGV